MTGRAIVIKVVLHMVGVGGRCEITGMARIAVAAGVHITGRMAGYASDLGVSSTERESGEIMVECCRLPGSRIVATGAIVVEIIRFMIGVVRGGKITLMAVNAEVACPGIN